MRATVLVAALAMVGVALSGCADADPASGFTALTALPTATAAATSNVPDALLVQVEMITPCIGAGERWPGAGASRCGPIPLRRDGASEAWRYTFSDGVHEVKVVHAKHDGIVLVQQTSTTRDWTPVSWVVDSDQVIASVRGDDAFGEMHALSRGMMILADEDGQSRWHVEHHQPDGISRAQVHATTGEVLSVRAAYDLDRGGFLDQAGEAGPFSGEHRLVGTLQAAGSLSYRAQASAVVDTVTIRLLDGAGNELDRTQLYRGAAGSISADVVFGEKADLPAGDYTLVAETLGAVDLVVEFAGTWAGYLDTK